MDSNPVLDPKRLPYMCMACPASYGWGDDRKEQVFRYELDTVVLPSSRNLCPVERRLEQVVHLGRAR